jgi:hypothetical protein
MPAVQLSRKYQAPETSLPRPPFWANLDAIWGWPRRC